MRAQFFAALIAFEALGTPVFAQEVSKTNCNLADQYLRASVEKREKLGQGPFRLVAIHCQPRLPSGFGARPAVTVSPDTNSIAVLNKESRGGERTLAVAGLSSATVDYVSSHEAWPLAIDGGTFDGRGAFRWATNSKTLWSANQERMQPTGWFTGPVRPLRIEDGMVRDLPELKHPAGQLDGLLWTEDGRGLGLFGARGDYYRPQIPNRNPTVAFVDAVNGRVIDSLPFTAIDPAFGAPGSGKSSIRAAEVVVLSDGRMRAFLSAIIPGGSSSWIVWTQGEAPRVYPNPYPGERISTAISSEGNRLLIVRQSLQMGGTCPLVYNGRGCEPFGPPVEGILAAMHDLQTGNVMWSRRERVTSLVGRYPVPALSGDGRYGLIALPDATATTTYSVALISTLNGSVEQVFSIEQGEPDFGFAPGSQRMWIHNGVVTSVYELR